MIWMTPYTVILISQKDIHTSTHLSMYYQSALCENSAVSFPHGWIAFFTRCFLGYHFIRHKFCTINVTWIRTTCYLYIHTMNFTIILCTYYFRIRRYRLNLKCLQQVFASWWYPNENTVTYSRPLCWQNSRPMLAKESQVWKWYWIGLSNWN